METEVECYSGMEYAERPLRFFWQEEWRGILQIITERRTDCGKEFDIVDEKDEKFNLVYDFASDSWNALPQREPAGAPKSKFLRCE
jgi:hypothetical protein